MSKTYTVYEVLADVDGDGPYGDGMVSRRFKNAADAARFAALSTCYGKPATVSVRGGVSRQLMQRWGMV